MPQFEKHPLHSCTAVRLISLEACRHFQASLSSLTFVSQQPKQVSLIQLHQNGNEPAPKHKNHGMRSLIDVAFWQLSRFTFGLHKFNVPHRVKFVAKERVKTCLLSPGDLQVCHACVSTPVSDFQFWFGWCFLHALPVVVDFSILSFLVVHLSSLCTTLKPFHNCGAFTKPVHESCPRVFKGSRAFKNCQDGFFNVCSSRTCTTKFRRIYPSPCVQWHEFCLQAYCYTTLFISDPKLRNVPS